MKIYLVMTDYCDAKSDILYCGHDAEKALKAIMQNIGTQLTVKIIEETE